MHQGLIRGYISHNIILDQRIIPEFEPEKKTESALQLSRLVSSASTINNSQRLIIMFLVSSRYDFT